MLSMASVSSASSAGSYYASDNYYTAEEGLGHSEWVGEAAAALGLSGAVDSAIFERVLAGELPNGEVISGGAKEHAPGFDLTFSAPKSVSLMALVGGDKRLIQAHHAAVKTTMAWVETRFAEARSGKDGRAVVPTGKLAYALFTHDVSRELDPQLHTHSVVANVTQRPDGAWRALHNGKIWNANMLIGAIYHNELRHGVTALGYGVENGGKNGTFELSGISRDTIEAWSSRHLQIREIAERLNITSPEGLSAIATRSREAKPEADPAATRAAWRELAQARGDNFSSLVPQGAEVKPERGVLAKLRSWGEALMSRVTPFFRPRTDALIADAPEQRRAAALGASYAVGASVRHLQEREASFSGNDVLQHAVTFAEQKARIGDIEDRIETLKGDGLLIAGKGDYASRLTTPDMVRIERQNIAAARQGLGRASASMSIERAAALVERASSDKLGFALNAEQMKAATAILASTDRYVTVQGGAGTGKSTVFAAVQAVDQAQRPPLFLLTPQNKLAAELQASTGIDARSLASFLTRFEGLAGTPSQPRPGDAQQYRGATLIVDEASMVSSRQMRGLMQITDKLGINRVVMVGDVGQIAAVEAGSPFRQLQENALDPIRLDENLRQRDDVMKLSVAKLQSGLVREAFDTLAERVVQNSDPVASAAQAWLALDDTTRAKTAMFTSGHRLRAQLLDTVRTELVREGKLGSTETRLPVLERLNLSQEQMRNASSYAPGMVLDVHRDAPTIGLQRGQYPVLAADAKAGTVELAYGNTHQIMHPDQLHPRGTGVSLSSPAEIGVRIGDMLQWTANDRELGIANGQAVRLDRINGDGMTLSDANGRSITLPADHPMRERLAHGLVTNMHKAQGITVEHAITVMASDDRALNTQSLAYVLSSRARGGFDLHVDDREKMIGQIEQSSGVAPTALAIVASHNDIPLEADNGRDNGPDVAAVPDQVAQEVKVRLPEKELGLSL